MRRVTIISKFNRKNKSEDVEEVIAEVVIENKEEEVSEDMGDEKRKGAITTTDMWAEKPVQPDPKDLAQIVVEDAPNKEPLFRVLPKKNHKCHIGGTWYYFVKDESQKVNKEIKDMLIRENLLRPL